MRNQIMGFEKKIDTFIFVYFALSFSHSLEQIEKQKKNS